MFHAECNPPGNAVNRIRAKSLPTRLIRVTMDAGNLTASLINTDCSKPFIYVTLSHGWGGKRFVVLEQNGIQRFQHGLDLKDGSFNKTFVEAMTLTVLLGYEYIWIDSLCIIQDSREDKERECLRMGHIFQNSVLTLSATGFEHGLDGMQANSRDAIIPPRLKSHGKEYVIVSDGSLIMHLPLEERGWVLQEALLVCLISVNYLVVDDIY
ncbi:heterokaryon incompatibility protein-domain-containing protein [Nemania sp. FL0916]|nr:heterokaryon incompatibility protein-domain-containing protein [Nemania sp. FL0916]